MRIMGVLLLAQLAKIYLCLLRGAAVATYLMWSMYGTIRVGYLPVVFAYWALIFIQASIQFYAKVGVAGTFGDMKTEHRGLPGFAVMTAVVAIVAGWAIAQLVVFAA